MTKATHAIAYELHVRPRTGGAPLPTGRIVILEVRPEKVKAVAA